MKTNKPPSIQTCTPLKKRKNKKNKKGRWKFSQNRISSVFLLLRAAAAPMVFTVPRISIKDYYLALFNYLLYLFFF